MNRYQKQIDAANKQYQKIIDDLKDIEATHAANEGAAVALSLKDLEELSMMVTRTKLIAMKLGLSHNRNEPTAMDDKNYSIRLQRFSQTLKEIHDFYGKQH